MADLSKLTVGGKTYNLKDAEARADIEELKQDISGGMHWRGVTTTALTDGATTNPITIDGESYTAEQGDEVTYNEYEFVWNGSKWQELGSSTRLKALAFKDSASGTVTPAGTNAASTVTLTGGSTGSVGSASAWNAGTMFTAVVDEASETLTLTAGTAPSLTVTPTTVATALHTGGTAAAQTFTGTQTTVTVS